MSPPGTRKTNRVKAIFHKIDFGSHQNYGVAYAFVYFRTCTYKYAQK
nr:MAG TPA: hypothetical protein [Caudoviricetes sp.]